MDAAGVPGTLRIAAEDDGGVLLVQLHRVADPPQLLTGHKGGAGAAEGVQHDGVLLGGIADGVAEQIQRL